MKRTQHTKMSSSKVPTAEHMPNMDARFYPAIWMGKDTSAHENILGISSKVVKASTIRRQIKPDKCNRPMMDVINASPAKMTPTTAPSIVVMPQPTKKKKKKKPATTDAETQTTQQPAAIGQQPAKTPAITDLPMATAPSALQAKSTTSCANTWQERSFR